MNVFEFVSAINFSKQDLFEDPQAEKDYIPFVVNRALSYFPDTIFYANEMNSRSAIPKRYQFEFLKESVPKRRRFSKWAKKDAKTDDLALIQKAYKYSMKRASEALSMLSEEQIESIRLQMDEGGKT